MSGEKNCWVPQSMQLPAGPGYYWAKLKTPSGGNFYCQGLPDGVQGIRIEPEADQETGEQYWVSSDWEIVEVTENDPSGDPKGEEYYSVQVFGIPVTQWVLDFYWGPKVKDVSPSAKAKGQGA